MGQTDIWKKMGRNGKCCRLPIPQHEVRKLGEVQLEGSNASAEEMEEGTEEASESGVDLVLNHRWAEILPTVAFVFPASG